MRLLDRLQTHLTAGPDLMAVHRLLSPACRTGCAGIRAQLTSESQGPSGPSERESQGPSGPSERESQGPSGPSERESEGYQVARWVERLGRGRARLLDDLGLIFGSYARIQRCRLTPLAVQRFFSSAAVRARLHCEGIDFAGWRRVDDGVLDLRLARGPAGWRVARLAPAFVHTVRREEAGYELLAGRGRRPPGAKQRRPLTVLMVDGAARALVEAEGRGVFYRELSAEGRPAGGRRPLFEVSHGPIRALLAADLNGDGRNDLFVGAEGAGTGVWLQGEAWRFTRSSRWPSIGGVVRAAAVADFDRDGWLDLFVVRRSPTAVGARRDQGIADLLLFGAAPGAVLRPPRQLGQTQGSDLCVGDLDDDGWPDAVVTDERGAPVLWMNRRGGRFEERGRASGLARDSVQTCALGDVDGDRRIDLVLGGRSGATLWLNRRISSTQRGIRWRARPLWAPRSVRGAVLADHDNDGDLDLFIRQSAASAVARSPRGADSPALWVNTGNGALVDAGWPAGLPAQRGARVGLIDDLDGDGALDLAGDDPSGGGMWVARWVAGAGDWGDPGATHAVSLLLRGHSPGNRAAVGARIVLRSEGRWQVREIGCCAAGVEGAPPGQAHFGVGSHVRVEELWVRWPDGEWERHHDLPVDRLIRVSQGEGVRWGPLSGPIDP